MSASRPDPGSQDTLHRLHATTALFGSRVHGVPRDGWDAETPCAAWDVRALVNHVAGEMLWAVPLLAGRTIAEVGTAFDGDLLGDDPVRAWDAAAAASGAAFGAEGALERTVALSYGPESAAAYADQLAFDALVHGWDLARGSGQSDDLPDYLVAWALPFAEAMLPMVEGTGMFAAQRTVPAGASAQARLLALLGRG